MFDFLYTAVSFRIAASIIVILLGIIHVANTNAILKEYKLVINAHRKILKMTWIVQGAFFCFVGILIIITGILFSPGNDVLVLTIRISAAALFVVAFIVGLTGALTEKIILRATPLVLIVAACLLFGSCAL